MLISITILLVIGAPVATGAEKMELFHIHGLSYSADGSKLYVPRHYGLAVYEKGQWFAAPGAAHDYMGFVGTRSGFYSSGHPAEGSQMVNPFGLMKSVDSGKSWTELGMKGESDFHVMAASYNTDVLYLLNLAPNSKMPFAGLASTADDGKHFRQSAARGIPQPFALAVHPDKPGQLAVGGNGGLYISTNQGDDFQVVREARGVYSMWYDLDGKQLWYGGIQSSPFLAVLDLATGKSRTVPMPAIEADDAVAYISQNPAKLDEFVIATFQRHLFITQNRGQQWQQLAEFGEVQ